MRRPNPARTRREGTESDAVPVWVGNHLATRPTGGKRDGVMGVLAGLEIVRSLTDPGIRARYPIVVIQGSSEQGPRFALLPAPGAARGAGWINRVAPTAMVSCPCLDAPSHKKAEEITPHRTAVGAHAHFARCWGRRRRWPSSFRRPARDWTRLPSVPRVLHRSHS